MGRRRRPRSASVEEAGESTERRGRGGREAVWKRRVMEETGPSHPDGVGSEAERNGPNVGAGSGVGLERRIWHGGV